MIFKICFIHSERAFVSACSLRHHLEVKSCNALAICRRQALKSMLLGNLYLGPLVKRLRSLLSEIISKLPVRICLAGWYKNLDEEQSQEVGFEQ